AVKTQPREKRPKDWLLLKSRRHLQRRNGLHLGATNQTWIPHLYKELGRVVAMEDNPPPNERQQQSSDSSRANEPVCRICYRRSDTEQGALIAPCSCKGSIGLTHQSCMERWLRERNTEQCDVCLHRLKVLRKPQIFAEVDRSACVIFFNSAVRMRGEVGEVAGPVGPSNSICSDASVALQCIDKRTRVPGSSVLGSCQVVEIQLDDGRHVDGHFAEDANS
ncbi:hypothetical protein HPB47_027889, partial [Ixodes persulcatus]